MNCQGVSSTDQCRFSYFTYIKLRFPTKTPIMIFYPPSLTFLFTSCFKWRSSWRAIIAVRKPRSFYWYLIEAITSRQLWLLWGQQRLCVTDSVTGLIEIIRMTGHWTGLTGPQRYKCLHHHQDKQEVIGAGGGGEATIVFLLSDGFTWNSWQISTVIVACVEGCCSGMWDLSKWRNQQAPLSPWLLPRGLLAILRI